jgi:hypothetical protein
MTVIGDIFSGIIDPHFFEDRTERAVAVDVER